jgi:hypothetical protein
MTTPLDSPWKQILESYFPQFMAFFFPEAYSQIDWERGFDFLDAELQQITLEADTGKRIVDKLVKVYLKNGKEELEASNNPFAMVVQAHLAAQATKDSKSQERRRKRKLLLMRIMYERDYPRQQIINLFRFIDWGVRVTF